MASSLSPQCTPLKRAYDQCFNSWFEGYLQPALDESSASRKPGTGANDDARRQYSKRKAEEFEVKCGKVWESYRACIAKAVTERGLDSLLDQARRENPLRDSEPLPPPPPVKESATAPPNSIPKSRY